MKTVKISESQSLLVPIKHEIVKDKVQITMAA